MSDITKLRCCATHSWKNHNILIHKYTHCHHQQGCQLYVFSLFRQSTHWEKIKLKSPPTFFFTLSHTDLILIFLYVHKETYSNPNFDFKYHFMFNVHLLSLIVIKYFFSNSFLLKGYDLTYSGLQLLIHICTCENLIYYKCQSHLVAPASTANGCQFTLYHQMEQKHLHWSVFLLCQREHFLCVWRLQCSSTEVKDNMTPFSTSAKGKCLQFVRFRPHLTTTGRNTHFLSHTADCSLTGTMSSIVGAGKEAPCRPRGVWLPSVSVCVCVDMGEIIALHAQSCHHFTGNRVWKQRACTHTHTSTHARTTPHTQRSNVHVQTQHCYHTEPYADPSLIGTISANQLLEGRSHTQTHTGSNPRRRIYAHAM